MWSSSESEGSVFFSSPELIEYATDKTYPVDYRSDIFQLGKVLWYLDTGRFRLSFPRGGSARQGETEGIFSGND